MSTKPKSRISSVIRKIENLTREPFTTEEEKAEKLRAKRIRDKQNWKALLEQQNKVRCVENSYIKITQKIHVN
jgi:hypothetical protein